MKLAIASDHAGFGLKNRILRYLSEKKVNAVDFGADDIYLGFKDETNARNFAGLNFDDASLRAGIAYAHRKGRKVLVAIDCWRRGL